MRHHCPGFLQGCGDRKQQRTAPRDDHFFPVEIHALLHKRLRSTSTNDPRQRPSWKWQKQSPCTGCEHNLGGAYLRNFTALHNCYDEFSVSTSLRRNNRGLKVIFYWCAAQPFHPLARFSSQLLDVAMALDL